MNGSLNLDEDGREIIHMDVDAGDGVGIRGHVVAELFGSDGKLKQREEMHNLVTDNGDKYCAYGCHAPMTDMDDMKLGTADTAAAKSGAGSYIAVGDYITGSAHACDDDSPKEGAAADIVQYIHTWAAGEATNATINRVAIVDNTTDAGEADATHTMATAVFPATIPKGADDTLKVTWNVTFLGA